eukprot:gene29100-36179_t
MDAGIGMLTAMLMVMAHGFDGEGTWQAISTSLACETNSEGLTYTRKQTGIDLATCKSNCETSAIRCTAIDFIESGGECNYWNMPCSTPAEANGVSYKFLAT